MSKEAKLKPCPFCGGEATEKNTYIENTGFMAHYVGCYSNKCPVSPCACFQNSSVADVGWDKSEKFMRKRLRTEAIKAWNRRAK